MFNIQNFIPVVAGPNSKPAISCSSVTLAGICDVFRWLNKKMKRRTTP
jgi:hypothetical protein